MVNRRHRKGRASIQQLFFLMLMGGLGDAREDPEQAGERHDGDADGRFRGKGESGESTEDGGHDEQDRQCFSHVAGVLSNVALGVEVSGCVISICDDFLKDYNIRGRFVGTFGLCCAVMFETRESSEWRRAWIGGVRR